jgi:streptomycin 6-kinase
MPDGTSAVPAGLVLKGAAISGEAGREWRRALPATVANLVQRWRLTIGAPFPDLSYNYVAPVTREDGTAAVLKLWFPFEREFAAEAEALRLYDGDGAVGLLEVDMEHRALLLERAVPGHDLWQLESEDRQIEITATVMQRLWRPAPPDCSLPRAREHYERMVEVAPKLAKKGFPLDGVAGAKDIFDTLEAAATPTVLHEDLHQSNILTAQREPWLAIDPHGLVGPPVIDTTQMILNAAWRTDEEAWPRVVARHVDALSEALDLDREQVALCGAARSILEAFWTLEDKGEGWERDVAIAGVFASAARLR